MQSLKIVFRLFSISSGMHPDNINVFSQPGLLLAVPTADGPNRKDYSILVDYFEETRDSSHLNSTD